MCRSEVWRYFCCWSLLRSLKSDGVSPGHACLERRWSACVKRCILRIFTMHVTALTNWITTPASQETLSQRTVFAKTLSSTTNIRSHPLNQSRCSFNLSCLPCMPFVKFGLSSHNFTRGWRFKNSSVDDLPVTLLGMFRWVTGKLSILSCIAGCLAKASFSSTRFSKAFFTVWTIRSAATLDDA